MSRVYFEGWYSGAYVKAEDWYKDNLIYVSVQCYYKSTAVSRPDKEMSFLLKLDEPERITEYERTIATHLSQMDEHRDADGQLIPLYLKLPPKMNFYARKSF